LTEESADDGLHTDTTPKIRDQTGAAWLCTAADGLPDRNEKPLPGAGLCGAQSLQWIAGTKADQGFLQPALFNNY
jgi:hypothetical protein